MYASYMTNSWNSMHLDFMVFEHVACWAIAQQSEQSWLPNYTTTTTHYCALLGFFTELELNAAILAS